MSKYGVVSGPYFPAFALNTEKYLSVFSLTVGKYGPKITRYFDFFGAVIKSSCHTLSKALDKFRKTPRTSREGLQSKAE